MVTNIVFMKIIMGTALPCFDRLAHVRYQFVVTSNGFANSFVDESNIRFFPSFGKVSLYSRIKKHISPCFQNSRTNKVRSTCLSYRLVLEDMRLLWNLRYGLKDP